MLGQSYLQFMGSNEQNTQMSEVFLILTSKGTLLETMPTKKRILCNSLCMVLINCSLNEKGWMLNIKFSLNFCIPAVKTFLCLRIKFVFVIYHYLYKWCMALFQCIVEWNLFEVDFTRFPKCLFTFLLLTRQKL